MAPTHFSRMLNILAIVCLGLISKVEAQMGVEFQVQFPYMPEGQPILMMYSTMMNKFDVYVTAPMWQNPALSRLQVTTYVVQRKYITSRSDTTTSIVAKGKFQFGMTVFMPVSFHSSFLAIPTSGWGAEYFILIPNFNWKRDVINRWQTSFSRLETGTRYISSANRSLIKLETRQIERLEEEIRPLIEEGFTWKDAFTQYTLQNVLLAFSRWLSFNRRLSEAALVDARDGPDVDLLESGKVDDLPPHDDQANDDYDEEELVKSNKRDVQVQTYFVKPTGLFKRNLGCKIPVNDLPAAFTNRNIPTKSVTPRVEDGIDLSWAFGALVFLFNQKRFLQILLVMQITTAKTVAQNISLPCDKLEEELWLALRRTGAESTMTLSHTTVMIGIGIIAVLFFCLMRAHSREEILKTEIRHQKEKNSELTEEIRAYKFFTNLEWRKRLVPTPNG